MAADPLEWTPPFAISDANGSDNFDDVTLHVRLPMRFVPVQTHGVGPSVDIDISVPKEFVKTTIDSFPSFRERAQCLLERVLRSKVGLGLSPETETIMVAFALQEVASQTRTYRADADFYRRVAQRQHGMFSNEIRRLKEKIATLEARPAVPPASTKDGRLFRED